MIPEPPQRVAQRIRVDRDRWIGPWVTTTVGLAARLATVAWAGGRFPPAGDGQFYDTVARRIAQGHGYTWLWPDQSVTFAAHYPVGYPALIGGLYAIVAAHPILAMLLNAALGGAAVYAVHRTLMSAVRSRVAFIGALLVALHPTLVAYTPALMTEGVAASLGACAGWGAVRVSRLDGRAAVIGSLGLGLLLGLTTLVRPQLVLMAPLIGGLVVWWRGRGRTWVVAVGVTLGVLTVCLPWTVRNCMRMERCVFVSANGGWNLLIGSDPRAKGSWVALDELGVPEPCRTVYGEAEKDACFGRVAMTRIQERPLQWAALVPAKLASTFDEVGAPGWYLRASNPSAFGEQAKLGLGALEVLWQRGSLLLGLLALALWPGRWDRARLATIPVSVVTVGLAAWVGYLLLAVLIVVVGPSHRRIPAVGLLGAVLAVTIVAHAVFFGEARYALVCFPWLSAVAALVVPVIEERRGLRRGALLTADDAARDT